MIVHIAVQTDGRHTCYRVTASGKGRVYEGCDHLTPRDAIRHSDELDRAATARSAQIIPAAGAFPEAASRTSEPSGPPRPAVEDRLPAPVPVTDIRAVAGRPGPCIFGGCVATWEHWHGGFPGAYDDPADPTGNPIWFTGPDPEPDAVRDYNGAALPRHTHLPPQTLGL